MHICLHICPHVSTHTYAGGNSSTMAFINGNQCLQRRQSIVLKENVVKIRKVEKNMVSTHMERNDKGVRRLGGIARHTRVKKCGSLS